MSSDPYRRGDVRGALRRDLKRHERRRRDRGVFWRSMRVLGMVGWPIAIASVGGAWFGHVLDRRFGTGVAFTLMLLLLGTVLGSIVAWRGIQNDHP